MNFKRGTNVKPPMTAPYRILYRIIGILLVVLGLLLTIVYPVAGIISGVLGCLLLQMVSRVAETEKSIIPKHPFKRPWQIIVIVLYTPFVMAGILIPTTIQSISINGNESITLEVPNTQQIVFQYEPATASASEIKCTSSNEEIATVSIDEAKDGKINCTITPVSTGTATIICTTSGVSSSPLKLSISDPAAEEAAKVEAERKEAEAKAAEEAAQQAEAEAAEQKAQEILKEASGEQSASESSGQTVYITPSGKRYHLDPDCAGKNAHAVDISNIGSRTPCKKCAGG